MRTRKIASEIIWALPAKQDIGKQEKFCITRLHCNGLDSLAMGTLYKKKEREKNVNYEGKRPIIYEYCYFKATQPEYLLESVQALNFKFKYNEVQL